MLVSVVGVVYNRAESVRRWLKSLSLQREVDLEVILVNYSSTDNLRELLREPEVSYKEIVVDRVAKYEDRFPEAYLKNAGIKVASGDVIVSTNVDLVYEPTFMRRVAAFCGNGFLVEAVRRDISTGVTVTPEARVVVGDGTPPASVVNDYNEWGIPLVAGADCQAMRKAYWHKLRGYDEELEGWGSLDSDMTCRAILSGMSVLILGLDFVNYVHAKHPANQEKNFKEALENGQRDTINLKQELRR